MVAMAPEAVKVQERQEALSPSLGIQQEASLADLRMGTVELGAKVPNGFKVDLNREVFRNDLAENLAHRYDANAVAAPSPVFAASFDLGSQQIREGVNGILSLSSVQREGVYLQALHAARWNGASSGSSGLGAEEGSLDAPAKLLGPKNADPSVGLAHQAEKPSTWDDLRRFSQAWQEKSRAFERGEIAAVPAEKQTVDPAALNAHSAVEELRLRLSGQGEDLKIGRIIGGPNPEVAGTSANIQELFRDRAERVQRLAEALRQQQA